MRSDATSQQQTHGSGGSSISRRWERQLSRRGEQHMILPNARENFMKSKEFGCPGEGKVANQGGSFRSANAYDDEIEEKKDFICCRVWS